MTPKKKCMVISKKLKIELTILVKKVLVED